MREMEIKKVNIDELDQVTGGVYRSTADEITSGRFDIGIPLIRRPNFKVNPLKRRAKEYMDDEILSLGVTDSRVLLRSEIDDNTKSLFLDEGRVI